MKVLFLFLDGIGLGSDDPVINPFAKVDIPYLEGLLEGKKLLLDSISGSSPTARLYNISP